MFVLSINGYRKQDGVTTTLGLCHTSVCAEVVCERNNIVLLPLLLEAEIRYRKY